MCDERENGNINTMFWRVCTWSEICKADMDCPRLVKEMRIADASANKDGNVDILFSNHAARLAFMDIRGYELPSMGPPGCKDASILTLARADAWMTTLLDKMLLEGKGGKRNNHFSDSFHTLLPLALDAIIKKTWNDINDLAPNELQTRIHSGQDVESDPYGNYLRDNTVVITSERGNYLYLIATPNYIKHHVCSWYGDLKDCYIGRCNMGDTTLTRICSSMSFEIESSDEIECESIEDIDV